MTFPGALGIARAERFRRLHRARRPFLLPNAWDVPSARVFEDAGFPAVATSSAGIMVSRGYPDGERMPLPELVEVVRRIASRLRVPVSADVVSGYGKSPAAVGRTVQRMLRAGAIGVNLEDHNPASGKLFPLDVQLQRIQAVLRTAQRSGVPLVLNARTDALNHAPGDKEARFEEAVRRAQAFRDAGADCVYPMGLTDRTAIRAFVLALRCPVNVMVRRGLPSVRELARLGVRRVSFGPSASYAAMGLLKRASREALTRGTFRTLVEGAITFDELNRLAERRGPSASG